MFNRKSIIIYILILTILLSFCLLGGCFKRELVLPGQSVPASQVLLDAIIEMKDLSGKSIRFYNINKFPDPLLARKSAGLCQIGKYRVNIWVSPKLPYAIQEAVAGHELGHIYQNCQNFPRIGTPRNTKGNPLIPKLSNLGSVINGLVLDPGADQWAMEHGFKVVEAIKSGEMRLSLAETLEIYKPNGFEAANWSKFYSSINDISKDIIYYTSSDGEFTLEPEIDTFIASVAFARSHIYAVKYGMWSESYFDIKREFPIATAKGYEIASIIEEIGLDTQDQCERAMYAVIYFLEIPTTLMYVDRP